VTPSPVFPVHGAAPPATGAAFTAVMTTEPSVEAVPSLTVTVAV
jgi:hypothetical protein